MRNKYNIEYLQNTSKKPSDIYRLYIFLCIWITQIHKINILNVFHSIFFFFCCCQLYTMTWFTITEHLCHKWPQICSVCHNHNPVLSSFMTYHWICNKCNTTGATSGAGTASHQEHLSSPSVFSVVWVAWSLLSV